ncbi:MAG: single-stranded-DNA-specific exonuclease RecJ [Candidatus Babeliaceae bacterium]|jgi:single-stranded-DNA-specific exonuclease
MIIAGAKYLWKLPKYDTELISKLVLRYNLSFPIVQALVNRGYISEQDFESFLFTSQEKDVGNPILLKDAQKAVARIIEAINNQEKILIAGDYDVDGITSSALMLICLLPLGAQVNFFLPHRVHDGYGLSLKTVERAARNNYKLIITVDNGITAFEPVLLAQKLGVDVIITDHHKPHEAVPNAYAVIDPHQTECAYPYKKFAGVGISFKIMSLLYEQLGKQLPEKVYELLLLGTVADVVPLTGENRYWVQQGLHKINGIKSFSLEVLKNNARVTKPHLSSTDIGFFIAPQINALGRLEDPREGVAFLIGSDQQETVRIGKTLGELNEARKSIEKKVLQDIEQAIAEKKINIETDKVIIAGSASWPSGVIGLVASRLVGQYCRPVILLHLTSSGIAKGSCRSIPEFNMFNALHDVRDILLTFGGHTVAAGLSLKTEHIELLKERLTTLINQQLSPEDLQHKITIDAHLTLPETNEKLLSDCALLEPFGCENPQPRFILKQVSLLDKPTLLKELHVKCTIFADGIIKPVIFFNRPDLMPLLENSVNQPCDMVVQVTENYWRDRKNIEFTGIDVCIS